MLRPGAGMIGLVGLALCMAGIATGNWPLAIVGCVLAVVSGD